MTAPRSSSTRYQQQRQKAIAAAATVFAHKGYHGASTQDIATEMGIQQGSLYYYFDSKEAALEEVCLVALRDYVSAMDETVAQVGPCTEKLATCISLHLASYRKHNEAMKVHNEQRLYLPESRRQQLKDLGSHYRQQLERIFEEGVSCGQLEAALDCHFAARSLIGLCNYWGSMQLRDNTSVPERLEQKILQLTLNGCLCSAYQSTEKGFLP